MITEMKLIVAVTPHVLLRARAFLLDLQFVGLVIAPRCRVATTDGALALIDVLGRTREGDSDGTAVADGLQGLAGGAHGVQRL